MNTTTIFRTIAQRISQLADFDPKQWTTANQNYTPPHGLVLALNGFHKTSNHKRTAVQNLKLS
ncbi:hypothetical protein B0181_02100 [Moraxella caviae]|uniref:Uncharacterized protein n=1 Tax=Moraxella caviae TaxID=34060 RepID=A0A1T0A8P1_9GAMM|nr:hypothetical protein [Moraxella caviae]OOR92094.1 hypothetical protein B0181_02100 [Moraxella caviae]STZ14450.1 Uncharacterised protein [Moraxella caviae]VEW10463.1 Uncharacterised protein [Moraxella caviae]